MKILVTGGCGNMGTHLVNTLAQQGHTVRVIDKNAEGLKQFTHQGIQTFAGDISDKEFIHKTVEGMNAIVHLAWSFSENFLELLDIDVKAYQYILDAAVENKVEHVINATTTVSYGKPQQSPVDETHPHLAWQSRDPSYALAKLITKEMGKIYSAQHDIHVNNVMIWYAYSHEIGGRNLRGMVRDAIEKGVITVPAGCGGSFLQIDDFISCVMGIIKARPKGELFNIGTFYLTWEELAQLIIPLANPKAKVNAIPKDEWKGSAFLVDDWNLNIEKAQKMLQFKTSLTREQGIAYLVEALRDCVEKVKSSM